MSRCALEVLLLGFNKINSIEDLDLQRCPRLRVLHLQSNNLSHLNGLSMSTWGANDDLVPSRPSSPVDLHPDSAFRPPSGLPPPPFTHGL